MKACVVQSLYSFNYSEAEKCFADTVSLLDACDKSMDIIVLPEYCDVPVYAENPEDFKALVSEYNGKILDKCKQTAIRCNALVFVNCTFETSNGCRNTTYAISERGEIIGKYFKAHPAPSEVKKRGIIDTDYSYSFNEPYILEYNGLRYGFMTCYDFYFYESFAALAKRKADIIIGASHQRTDTHLALDIMGRFLAYNTNAYLVRASVSLGENSLTGGSGMIAAPNGDMLLNMKNRRGLGVAEFNPKEKYLKPAGFKGALSAHYEYIESGRRPWLYRNGGSKVIRNDDNLPYPRVCAHRGFSAAIPENSLPAFGAAVALGAQEIEFDLYETKDKVLVSIHDSSVDRVSDGTGYVWDYTFEELRALDFGKGHAQNFKGLKIPAFEEILNKFAAITILNIHVKEVEGMDYERVCRNISNLLEKYDCKKHAYTMSECDEFSKFMHAVDPEINRCVGAGSKPWQIVDRAIELGCEKVQLFKPYFNREMIEKAHAHNIKCNVFFADDPQEAVEYLKMGADTVLTNDYFTVASAVEKYIKEK